MNTPSSKRKLGSVELGLLKSQNEKTQDRLVWAARATTGLPALVNVTKVLAKAEWSEWQKRGCFFPAHD